MQRFFLSLLFVFIALDNIAQAADEVRYYDVETIIFESLDPAARQSENWKSDIDRKIPPVVAELDQPYPGPIPPQYDPALTFKTLPGSAYQLQNEEKLLTDSRQYRILLHTAWVQPGMPPEAALPVHIVRNFLTETPVSRSLIPASPDMPPSNLTTPDTPTQTRAVLDGYIKIILTRYLHADVDLVYSTGLPLSAPANPTTSTTSVMGAAATTTMAATPSGDAAALPQQQTPPVIYRLTESRRMRSTELHYLDHPVLGMLLLITQHEENKAAPAPKR